MMKCWAQEPSLRPRFSELKSMIEGTKRFLNPPSNATTAEYRSDSDESDAQSDRSNNDDSDNDSIAYADRCSDNYSRFNQGYSDDGLANSSYDDAHISTRIDLHECPNSGYEDDGDTTQGKETK